MSIESNSGTEYYAQSCGIPSSVGLDVDSNLFTGYYYNEPNDYILWGQDTYYPHVSTNIPTVNYFLECDRSSDVGLNLESNYGTRFYYSSAFNCVAFCDGLGSVEMDVAAAAYVAAIEAAGVSVSNAQKMAITTFIEAEKSANRWDRHKRIWLPIWANATANAICMRSLSSGTYPNGATHSSGYWQGDGINQYFNTNVNYNTIVTNNNTHAFALVAGPELNGIPFGVNSNGNNLLRMTVQNTGAYLHSVTVRSCSQEPRGVISLSISGFYGYMQLATNTTNTKVLSVNNTVNGIVPNIPLHFNGYNDTGIPSLFSTLKLGVMGMGLAIAPEDGEAFTSNVKTLWENSTGLTMVHV